MAETELDFAWRKMLLSIDTSQRGRLVLLLIRKQELIKCSGKNS